MAKVLIKLPLAFDLTLYKEGRSTFSVVYGEQTKAHLSYAEAAKEFGECMMHALQCQGVLDNG